VINQTEVAKKTGIPLGSMTAAIKKAVDKGLITIGPAGSLKLTPTQ
jgi:DNA-binding MarR family transcriptional regulator